MKSFVSIGILCLGTLGVASPFALNASPQIPPPQDAPIAMLFDANTGQILHQREASRRFLPASVTKVMTAYIAFEMLADGRLKPDQNFLVSERVFKEWSGVGSSMFLQADERVTVDKLLHGITTVSANDGCIAFAEGATGSLDKWVQLMNQTAMDLGMHDSHFESPNGFPDGGRTFTTASDLAKLTRAMMTRHPRLYAHYFGKRTLSHNGYTQVNHDPITGIVQGADGIKTGFTREAGYTFLGSAKRDGERLGIVLAGISNGRTRARIAREYLELGFAGFDRKRIFAADAVIGTAKVQNGAARSVELRSAVPVAAEVLAGTNPKITMNLRYKGPVIAPIRAGSEIAELEVNVDGFKPYTIPLVAASGVAEANAFHRVVNGVAGLFS